MNVGKVTYIVDEPNTSTSSNSGATSTSSISRLGNGIKSTASATGRGLKSGAAAVGRGLKSGVAALGSGVSTIANRFTRKNQIHPSQDQDQTPQAQAQSSLPIARPQTNNAVNFTQRRLGGKKTRKNKKSNKRRAKR